jgi:hypothetical protein
MKRFEEASKERKKAEELFEKMKKDPFNVMQELGLNPRELSENFLLQKLIAEQQEAELTVDQKENRDLKHQLEEYKRKEEEFRLEHERKQQQSIQQQLTQSYEQDFIKALETSSLPKNPTSLRRIAEVMVTSLSRGYDMPVSEAVQMVEEDVKGGMLDVLKALKGENLVKALGKEALEELRKYELSKLKNPSPEVKQDVSPKKSQSKKPKYLEDFLANLR